VVLVVLVYSIFVGNGWVARSATVYVNAHNLDDGDISLTVYANGHLLFDDDVHPMERVSIEYAPFFLDGNQSVTVRYWTEEGSEGASNGSWTFTVERGEVMNLNVPL
jgi:hypothetical protein